MKPLLVSLAVLSTIFLCGGCASFGKKKSSARLYEGDTSPNIRMFEEKPGYPLNNL